VVGACRVVARERGALAGGAAGVGEGGCTMTREQRRFHAKIWLVLGPVLMLGLAALVAGRPASVDSPKPAAGARP
jgi:hypothetical protein